MYEIKPLTSFINIPVPKCVYTLKHDQTCENSEISTQIEARLNKPCGLDMNQLSRQIDVLNKKSCEEIVERQTAVLNKLKELQKLLAQKVDCLEKLNDQKMEPLPELVISANPNNVPYTLQALQSLWKNSIQFRFKFYKHSSLSQLPQEAKLFEQALQRAVPTSGAPTQAISITLIWMQCGQTELISSTVLHAPIYGEVNMLRYLTRIGPFAWRYDNLREANQIDALLDACHQFVCCKNDGISSLLGNYFNKDVEFLFGKQISIADVYLLVTVKQKFKPNFITKDMLVKFNAWRKRLENLLKC